jgi:hypothetical protein
MNRLIICIFPIGSEPTLVEIIVKFLLSSYNSVYFLCLWQKVRYLLFFFSSLLFSKFFSKVSFRFIVFAFVSLKISPGSR